MEVSYLMTVEEISLLGELLDVKLPESYTLKEYEMSQSLFNKGFLFYEEKKVVVDPVVSFILRELSQSQLISNDSDKDIYQSPKIVIQVQRSQKNLSLQVFENLQLLKNISKEE